MAQRNSSPARIRLLSATANPAQMQGDHGSPKAIFIPPILPLSEGDDASAVRSMLDILIANAKRTAEDTRKALSPHNGTAVTVTAEHLRCDPRLAKQAKMIDTVHAGVMLVLSHYVAELVEAQYSGQPRVDNPDATPSPTTPPSSSASISITDALRQEARAAAAGGGGGGIGGVDGQRNDITFTLSPTRIEPLPRLEAATQDVLNVTTPGVYAWRIAGIKADVHSSSQEGASQLRGETIWHVVKVGRSDVSLQKRFSDEIREAAKWRVACNLLLMPQAGTPGADLLFCLHGSDFVGHEKAARTALGPALGKGTVKKQSETLLAIKAAVAAKGGAVEKVCGGDNKLSAGVGWGAWLAESGKTAIGPSELILVSDRAYAQLSAAYRAGQSAQKILALINTLALDKSTWPSLATIQFVPAGGLGPLTLLL